MTPPIEFLAALKDAEWQWVMRQVRQLYRTRQDLPARESWDKTRLQVTRRRKELAAAKAKKRLAYQRKYQQALRESRRTVTP